MEQEIYFDNSATTRPAAEVVQAVLACMENTYGNPSSVHRKGIAAEKVVNRARETVANMMRVQAKEVVFTSGGTESNNLALKGTAFSYSGRGKHIITTAVEHPAVRNVCQGLEENGFEITYLPVDCEGVISAASLERELRADTILVSTMYVNNETGSVQPLEEIAGMIKGGKKGGKVPLWHVDAVQALGRMPLDPAQMGIDLVSLSAHKVHGPKGTGALYVKEGIALCPQAAGGGQERGLRSGTENVPGIAGFGAAAQGLQRQGVGRTAAYLAGLRKMLVEGILGHIPDCRLNGPLPGSRRAAPHIANISFLGVRGEVLVHWLEDRGIYVSTGAACSSRGPAKEGVLNFLGLDEAEIESAVRFSFSPVNTPREVEIALHIIKKAVEELRSFG